MRTHREEKEGGGGEINVGKVQAVGCRFERGGPRKKKERGGKAKLGLVT